MSDNEEIVFFALLLFLTLFLFTFPAGFGEAWPMLTKKAFLLWVDAYSALFWASIFISVFLVLGIAYSLIRLSKIRREDKKRVHHVSSPLSGEKDSTAPGALRWQRVEQLIHSDNPSEWRHAIFEADILLDDLLDSLGYYGQSIGEKLKKVSSGDFRHINEAWEAHKIRNAIAHEGVNFSLPEREARRAISFYEAVFREFEYI